jgi:uncharacterized protein (UPF0332 family)
MDKIYKSKFLERLKVDNIEKEKGLYHSLASSLYFAVFTYMQAFIREAPQGKWKHGAIAKPFSKTCYEKGIYNSKTLKEFIAKYEELYKFRVYADYKRHIFTEEEKKEINKIYQFFLEVFRYE